MKKTTIGILAIFTLLILLTTACKKEYSCKCTGSALGVSADTTINLGKMTKKDAKSQCSNYQSTAQVAASIASGTFGVNITVNCDVQ